MFISLYNFCLRYLQQFIIILSLITFVIILYLCNYPLPILGCFKLYNIIYTCYFSLFLLFCHFTPFTGPQWK